MWTGERSVAKVRGAARTPCSGLSAPTRQSVPRMVALTRRPVDRTLQGAEAKGVVTGEEGHVPSGQDDVGLTCCCGSHFLQITVGCWSSTWSPGPPCPA